MKSFKITFIFLSLSFLLLNQCAKVPVSGRSQLSLVKNEKVFPQSFAAYEQVLDSAKVITDTPDGQMIVRVGTRIKNAVQAYFEEQGSPDYLNDYEWEFNLIEADVVNAWAMPGGKVAFYTGILPITQDETGVAVVMGHEVAHAVANHGSERMSQGMLAQYGMAAASIALGGGGATPSDELILQAAGMGTNLGMLSFSRKHESEADELGLIFMAIAGYNPEVAPTFWERMNAGGGERPPEFVSTHPNPETRIRDLNNQMPRALEYFQRYKDKNMGGQ